MGVAEELNVPGGPTICPSAYGLTCLVRRWHVDFYSFVRPPICGSTVSNNLLPGFVGSIYMALFVQVVVVSWL